MKKNKIDIYSENLLNNVLKKIDKNLSTVDNIANVLNINYDAAYRRLNGKVKLSLEEAVLLANHFNISLNELFCLKDKGSFTIKETEPINTIHDFGLYLQNVYNDLSILHNKPDSYVLFASREFPMFYFFNNEHLIKLKIYLWFNLLKITPVNKRIHYDEFIVTDKIIENAKKVGALYNKLNITEIWSVGALNNILMQIIYFNKLNQISLTESKIMMEELKNAVRKIEEKTFSEEFNFQLYQNDIIMNNNAIIIDINGNKKFFYPYTLLKYFTISDPKACIEQENYIREQLLYCTKITRTNIKDHTLFFEDKFQKIDDAYQYIIHESNKKTIFI